LLAIPSPSGYTDRIVHHVGEELERLGIPFELTRRGAIRARLAGKQSAPGRAIVSHLDTLGAMVKNLKSNGRLEVVPIGTWSSRFAEGARVTVFTDNHGAKRGTILPLKASGHTFNEEIDTQPVSWDNVEIRTDDFCTSAEELAAFGYNIGDFIAIDPQPEFNEGFINSRHLDDKAGVAAMLAAAKAVIDAGVEVSTDCSLLFTISEEVGTGASTATWPKWSQWTRRRRRPARTHASEALPSAWRTRTAHSTTTSRTNFWGCVGSLASNTSGTSSGTTDVTPHRPSKRATICASRWSPSARTALTATNERTSKL
jgi:putative aminopeptidase FrvX